MLSFPFVFHQKTDDATKNAEREFQFLREFTETYRRFDPADRMERELAVAHVQFPYILQPLQSGDRFAGRMKYAALAFSPQVFNGVGYYFDAERFETLLQQDSLSASQRKELKSIHEFWQAENTPTKIRAAYPDAMQQALPSDNWNGESGIGFPLYRMSGSQLDIRNRYSWESPACGTKFKPQSKKHPIPNR